MTYTVYETSVSYVTENGAHRSVVYTLLCRWGADNIGRIYDIRCAKIGEDFDVCGGICCETYAGVSDNRAKAFEITLKLVDALVMPEHLICVVDELVE